MEPFLEGALGAINRSSVGPISVKPEMKRNLAARSLPSSFLHGFCFSSAALSMTLGRFSPCLRDEAMDEDGARLQGGRLNPHALPPLLSPSLLAVAPGQGGWAAPNRPLVGWARWLGYTWAGARKAVCSPEGVWKTRLRQASNASVTA